MDRIFQNVSRDEEHRFVVPDDMLVVALLPQHRVVFLSIRVSGSLLDGMGKCDQIGLFCRRRDEQMQVIRHEAGTNDFKPV